MAVNLHSWLFFVSMAFSYLHRYLNDLFPTDLESEICNFADDTTIYACDTSVDAVTIKVKDDLQSFLIGLKIMECEPIQQFSK